MFEGFKSESSRNERIEQGEAILEDEDELPRDLLQLMIRAWDLKELHEVGAVFNYPDALTSEEWVALRALQAAGREIEKQEREKAEEERELKEREMKLKRLTGRT